MSFYFIFFRQSKGIRVHSQYQQNENTYSCICATYSCYLPINSSICPRGLKKKVCTNISLAVNVIFTCQCHLPHDITYRFAV